MSRIVNLKTVRFKIFNVFDSWHAQWFESKQYQSVLYEDLALRSYFIGIFYRLKVPTNYFFIKRLGTKDIIIHTDLFFIKYFKKSKLKYLFTEQIKYFSYMLKLYAYFYNYFFTSYLTNQKTSYYQDFFFTEKSLKQIGFIGLLNHQKLLNSLGRYFDDSLLQQKNKQLIYVTSFWLNDLLLANSHDNLKFAYDKYFISSVRLISIFYNKYLIGKLMNSLAFPINGIPSYVYDLYLSIILKSSSFFFKEFSYLSINIFKYLTRGQFLMRYLNCILREKKVSNFSQYYNYFKGSYKKISNVALRNNIGNSKRDYYSSYSYLLNFVSEFKTIYELLQKTNNIFFDYWYMTKLINNTVGLYYKALVSVLFYNLQSVKSVELDKLVALILQIDILLKKVSFYSRQISLIISRNSSDLVNYFSYSLHFKKYFSIIKYIKGKYYRYSHMYLEGNYSKKLVKKRLFNDFFTKFFNQFIIKIEETIKSYTKQNVYFLCNYYYIEKGFPTITNAKIICDYIVYQIHNNIRLKTIFHKVRRWQLINNDNKKYLENQFFSNQLLGKADSFLDHLSYKRYPIMGIRIECSGTSKKGTRKRKIFYGDWIKDFDLVSKSPNNTFSADLDYYQSFAIVKSCSIGVKVWVFFKTHLYNSNNEFISLVSY